MNSYNSISVLMHELMSERRSYKKRNNVPGAPTLQEIIIFGSKLDREPAILHIFKEQFDKLMSTGALKSLILYKENDKWIAMDNTTGEAQSEVFSVLERALDWLNNR